MTEIFNKQIFAKIAITERSRTSFIPVSEITHIQCDGYVSTLFLKDSPSIAVSKLLKQFEDELAGFEFMRINKNILVNPLFVERIERKENSWVVEIKNNRLPVSRRKVPVLKHFVSLHFGNHSFA